MGELLGILGEVARVIDFLNEPRHELEERSGVAIHHRDIKPQNIMLIGQGVKLADFGLSCPGDPGGSAKSQCGLTFAYAAPETFRRRVFATSDQYSLAVTYAQLRGGRLPFVGPPASVMMGHLFGDPDLSMLPESERPAVARALAKQPGERWPDCRSFIEVLAGCARAGSPDVLAFEPCSSSGPDESSGIEIPPLSESWDERNSVSSEAWEAGDDDGISAYCLGLPSPEALDAGLHDESSTAPTVVVAAGETFRRSPPGGSIPDGRGLARGRRAGRLVVLVEAPHPRGGAFAVETDRGPCVDSPSARPDDGGRRCTRLECSARPPRPGSKRAIPPGPPARRHARRCDRTAARHLATDASTRTGSIGPAGSGPHRAVPGDDRGVPNPGVTGLDTNDPEGGGRRPHLAGECPGGPSAVDRSSQGLIDSDRPPRIDRRRPARDARDPGS